MICPRCSHDIKNTDRIETLAGGTAHDLAMCFSLLQADLIAALKATQPLKDDIFARTVENAGLNTSITALRQALDLKQAELSTAQSNIIGFAKERNTAMAANTALEQENTDLKATIEQMQKDGGIIVDPIKPTP